MEKRGIPYQNYYTLFLEDTATLSITMPKPYLILWGMGSDKL
ncbi:MAG: hypothetical protein K0Q48_2083 [Bacillota bacterium]|jgi:hypothetical protein|nr:hypothetical protein [Bacillota bacterium]